MMKNITRAALVVAILSTQALADVGGNEPGTYTELDRETTTYIERGGLYLQQLHRSRFDRKDPNYYWLFDDYPCLYTEVWSAKYPCPERERYHDDGFNEVHKTPKDVPEPETLYMILLGLISLLGWRYSAHRHKWAYLTLNCRKYRECQLCLKLQHKIPGTFFWVTLKEGNK